MDYKNKCSDASTSDGCLYQGVLITGEPILCISGSVNEDDCQWAIESLDDLISDGKRQIVFDCSGIERYVKNWFAKKIQNRVSEFEGDLRIQIRDMTNNLNIEISRTKKAKSPKLNRPRNSLVY